MEGRDLVRSATLDQYRRQPDFAQREADDPSRTLSLYPTWKYEGYAWGMVIDTSACIGCNACIVACQAENNIPSVRIFVRTSSPCAMRVSCRAWAL